jgi:hypothetical protein
MELKLTTAVDADKCCDAPNRQRSGSGAAAEELWAGLEKR